MWEMEKAMREIASQDKKDISSLPEDQPKKVKEPKAKKPKKKRRKWPWVLLVLALIIVGVIVYLQQAADKIVGETVFSNVATTALSKKDVQNSVNVSGTVSSDTTEKVYAPLTGYTIDEVFVEVGDQVMVGDVICKLDTTSLITQIDQQEAAVRASERVSGANVSSARRGYETAQEQYEDERSSAVLNAQTAVTNAESAYQKAVDSYDDTELLYDLGEVSESDLDTARTAVNDAQTAVEDSIRALESARKASEDAVKSARDSVNTAQAGTDTQSQKIAIEDMKRQLEKGDIHAPMTGTVTYLNADKGAVANGLMFLIEDLEDLIIDTKVREYDAPKVSLGQKVMIKSDATGDTEFSGIVSYVAPTAMKTSAGATAASSTNATVEFETKVKVDKTSSSEKLKVGSNAQIYVIIEEVFDTWAVSYNAVLETDDGQNLLLVKETTPEGQINLREVPVTLGVQSDFLVEIHSPELQPGMEIVDTPRDYYDLLQQIKQAGQK